MANFLTKPWTNRFGKITIFDFLIGRFYSPERRLYFLEYRETHFLAYFASNKKMEIFLYFKREQQVQ